MSTKNSKFLKDLCRTLTMLGINDTALGLNCEDYKKVRDSFDNEEMDRLIIDRETNYFTVQMPNQRHLHIKQLR